MLIVVASAIMAFIVRHNTKKCITYITVGIFLATFFLVFPTKWEFDSSISIVPAYKVYSALMYSLSAVSGGQDIAQIESIELGGIWRAIYIALNYIFLFVTPLMASSLIISLFGDFGERMRYWFSFSKKCCVFSGLNCNSLVLADSMAKKKQTVVFCDTRESDEALKTYARKKGFIMLYTSCEGMRISKKFNSYEFFLISKSEDENIKLAEKLALRHRGNNSVNIVINAFAESGTNIKVIEQFLKKDSCDIFEALDENSMILAEESRADKVIFCNSRRATAELRKRAEEKGYVLVNQSLDCFKPYPLYFNLDFALIEKDGKKTPLRVKKNRLTRSWADASLQVRFIDEIALFCNDIVYKNPLFANAESLISVMIVGCGRLGMRMLRTAVWCGQVMGYGLKIRVYDKDAKQKEKELFKQCPELALSEYDIKFIQTDIQSADFQNDISDSLDATHVTVSTGSDELNIATADELFTYFRRHNNFDKTPPIFARVRGDVKSLNLRQGEDFLTERNIHIFGTTETIFSDRTLFNSGLEKLAFAVHLCYFGALNEDENSFYYNYVKECFRNSEYDRRSSMATALHFASKLHACGLIQGGEEIGEEKLVAFEKLIKEDGELLEELAKNEHTRWNAFMRSEGYCKAEIAEMKVYAKKVGSHKDELSKLHPCITSWDELDKVAEEYDKLGVAKKKSDFKKYDIDIVKQIPEIVRKANSL